MDNKYGSANSLYANLGCTKNLTKVHTIDNTYYADNLNENVTDILNLLEINEMSAQQYIHNT